jgi:hypothetical protein
MTTQKEYSGSASLRMEIPGQEPLRPGVLPYGRGAVSHAVHVDKRCHLQRRAV